MGRAPCIKETLHDFHEWCRVTRHPRLFHKLSTDPRVLGHHIQHLLDLHEPMVCNHQISSPNKCRRMMCSKPLEATRTSLTNCCTSMCNSSSRNPYSLNKSLLVKYWWCLTSTSWTPSTPSPSTSHLHMSNGS